MSISDALSNLRFKFTTAATKQSVTREYLDNYILGLLDTAQGMALSERHGAYAYPIYAAEMMERFAEKGVTRFFVEMIHHRNQYALDWWQDEGDPRHLIDIMNKQTRAHATGQWQHYWEMLQAAQKAGIRVIGVNGGAEPHLKPEEIFPKTNEFWISRILEQTKAVEHGEKYIVFGGRGHFRSLLSGNYGVARRMRIPAILMHEGPYAVSKGSDVTLEYPVYIPMARHQIAYFRGEVVKHHVIPYPEPWADFKPR